MEGSGFRVQGSGFRVQVSEFRGYWVTGLPRELDEEGGRRGREERRELARVRA